MPVRRSSLLRARPITDGSPIKASASHSATVRARLSATWLQELSEPALCNALFYLATAPDWFTPVTRSLEQAGLLERRTHPILHR